MSGGGGPRRRLYSALFGEPGGLARFLAGAFPFGWTGSEGIIVVRGATCVPTPAPNEANICPNSVVGWD